MASMVHNGDPALIQRLGGQAALAGLERRAAELRLPTCPFCGGGAQVSFWTDGAQLCAAVRCGKCGASTQTVNGLPSTGALLAACALRWSRRE